MSKGINKVIIVGNLGQDPETKFTASGGAITNISVATSESWKDKQAGQMQEKTEWHRIVFFNRLAEIAGEYLRKGSKVYIEGKLQTRKWQDQNGQDRYSTEIVANEMQMLDSRAEQGAGNAQNGAVQYQQNASAQNVAASRSNQQQGGYQQPQQGGYQQPAQQGGYQNQGGQAPAPQQGMDQYDDDIAF